MGVIHKLREDVVSFIITLKKNNPSIGVRQLSALTSEQFHVQVSKSSVNSVLKKSALSSSVGRRSGIRARSEKFSIPSVKKSQISKNMQAVGFQKEEPLFAEEKDPVQERRDSKEEVLLQEKKKHLEQKQDQGEEESPLGAELEPVKEKEEAQEKEGPSTEIPRKDWRPQGTAISDGAGFIFLKAAQWDLAERSLMAELFKKYIQSSVSDRFDSLSDMFLFLKFLGEDSFESTSTYRGHGLGVLNHFCQPSANENKDLLELQELFQWDKTMQKSSALPSFIMEYNKIKEQAFLEVKGLKLFLEDKTEITMDAEMASFGGGSSIPPLPYGSSPIHKAMARLSNALVSNIQNAVFHKAPGEARFDRVVYDMVAVFENIPGKRILKISVLDLQGEEMARFSTVPFQKRAFLMGVTPQQKEFGELTKSVKWAEKKSFYHEGTDRTVYFTETKTNFMTTQIDESVDDYRIITVRKGEESAPSWGILTNQQKGSGEDILKEYMSQWPYFGESLQEAPIFVLPPGNHEESQKRENKDEKKDFSIFRDFVGALHKYCQRQFFPPAHSKDDINCFIADVYGVPGSYYEGEGHLTVFLDVEKGSPYRKDLQYAVKRVNERHILDYCGRRLWLEI
jgi:hypothetical protein